MSAFTPAPVVRPLEPPGSGGPDAPAATLDPTAASAAVAALGDERGPVEAAGAPMLTASVPSDEALDAVELDAAKLHVYQVALELHAQCSVLVAALHRVMRDQLERASLSVLLNTAEAAGRRSRRDKARHFAYARGSATEVGALLDALERRRLASPAAIKTARRLAVRCVQMLTRVHQRLS